ncbi:MAG: hypothetical protein ACRD3V_16250, partial [Vicinamibacteria bacterium]
RRLACLDLLELLKELGATVRCFHHTEEETAGVLENKAASLRGKTVEQPDTFMSEPFTLAEVEELLMTLPQKLKELGIEVIDTPTWTVEPDEAELADAIEEEVHYLRDRAREKDVMSLAAVYRLRNGRRMLRFEDARAVFLTTNTTLARAASSFFRDLESNGAVPLAMSLTMMSRLAWVKKPLAAPDLPAHLVRASAYAALNPSNALWRTYMEEADRRLAGGAISPDEYHFLRSSREAREALMDVTLGDEDAFTAGTLDEIRDHFRRTIQEEAKAETNVERAAKELAHKEARSARGQASGLVQVHREDAERKAMRVGSIASWSFAVVTLVAALVGLVATIPDSPLIGVGSITWRIVIWACVAVFLGLTAYAVLVKNVSVFDVRRMVASRVTAWDRERRFRKLDALHRRAGVVAPDSEKGSNDPNDSL